MNLTFYDLKEIRNKKLVPCLRDPHLSVKQTSDFQQIFKKEFSYFYCIFVGLIFTIKNGKLQTKKKKRNIKKKS